MQNSIKIGPSFFAKAKNDYADWRWAWVRELAQNSIDAPGTTRLEFSFGLSPTGQNTMAACSNNGKAMSKETLVNKFLSIGESGKGFQGAVGGFGKAKELIAFTHLNYSIRTGDLFVQGEGAQYDLAEGLGVAEGTTTIVMMAGDEIARLSSAVRKFAECAQWDGEIFLNGEKLVCNLKKGSPRREFSWGTVYTNKSFKNRVVVRVNGMPMFTRWTDLDRTVVIELKGASVDVLTANRDGLVYDLQSEFNEFIGDLVTNKTKALKAPSPTYVHYEGEKFSTCKTSALDLLFSQLDEGERTSALATSGDFGGEPAGFSTVGEFVRSQISEEFILKNETTLQIPAYYQPDSEQFGSHGKKLARIWGRLVLELHRMFEVEKTFAIGFVFSDDCEAQYAEGDRYGIVYYLNPAVVVEQKASQSKSFRKRFQLTERDRLLAIAVHEFVHGLGLGSHNEDYANRLTDVFGKVMKERKRFNPCFV